MSDLAAAFDEHRRYLWGLAYRLTGSAADADDVVQTAFLRALERPPRRGDLPWRPWLVRVALNAGRDLLRRRRRRRYDGPWLPSPLETEAGEPPSFEPEDASATPLARYERLESLSFAFLIALERLTPAQRAVLLLRDAFDYSVRETAVALEMSEANVKTTHRRARLRMADYDRERRPLAGQQPLTRIALERFLGALSAGDVTAVEGLLAEDVRHVSDAGGEFAAARAPVVGRDRVARLFLGLASRAGVAPRVALRVLNGLPAVLVEIGGGPPRTAPRFTLHARLDPAGRIAELAAVLATPKLTRVAGIEGAGG